MRKQWLAACALVFCSAFMIGVGLGQMLVEYRQAQNRIPTVVELEEGVERLDEALNGVSIEKELFAQKNGRCEARLQNMEENHFSARVKLVRRATGEILYESGLIDPGYYVEQISLRVRLREGWYPCSVIWEFYDPQTLKPEGKAAQSAVLIVQT